MNQPTIEQIAADIHALREDKNVLTGVLRAAVISLCSSSFIAARIQSAKTDYERNEAVKEANGLLETMKKSLSEANQ